MTTQPNYAAPSDRKLSKSSLISFILGILVCLPLGVFAVIMGIIGFIRTGNPMKKGRWMAVVGILLGIASTGVWALVGGGTLLAFFAGNSLVSAFKDAPVATHDFIKALSENDAAAIKLHDGGFKPEKIQEFVDYLKLAGKFVDTSFNSTNVENGVAEISGTAQFETTTLTVKASLENQGGTWKVIKLDLRPVAAP